jgi:hypothetical protein
VKLVNAVTAFAVSVVTSTGCFANCGPAGVFKDNDYCVSCAGKMFKENYCPGGEAGRVTVGRQHPNCTVSFYDGDTCRIRGMKRRR